MVVTWLVWITNRGYEVSTMALHLASRDVAVIWESMVRSSCRCDDLVRNAVFRLERISKWYDMVIVLM